LQKLVRNTPTPAAASYTYISDSGNAVLARWTSMIVRLSLVILVLQFANIAVSDEQDMVARGEYIVMIGGCNDCHTAGYLATERNIDKDVWLTGDNFGWRGPWGTTYGANLRKFMQPLTEEQWVALAKVMTARPPMPWFALNKMKGDDLRAVYRFVRSLGPSDNVVPAYVPPGEEPNTPYALFPSSDGET